MNFIFPDTKPKLKSHYRIHQLSLWLHLVPALNQPGVGVPNSHHLLDEHGNDETYDGLVRTLVFTKPTWSTTQATIPAAAAGAAAGMAIGLNTSAQQGGMRSSASSSSAVANGDGDERQDGQVYTTALAVTIGIGLSLLLINILIFAGVYYQTRRRSGSATPPSTSAAGMLMVTTGGSSGVDHQQVSHTPIPFFF